MSPTIHWPVSHPPTAIVTARKMTAATRPAANATVASAVARIIAGSRPPRRTAPGPGHADGRGSAAALRLGLGDQDQPRCGSQEDRTSNRHRRPGHRPGYVPCLSQPGQPEHRAEEVLRPDGSHARHPLTCRYRACPGSWLALLSPRTACPGTGHLTAGHRRARGHAESFDRFRGPACWVMIAAGQIPGRPARTGCQLASANPKGTSNA